MRYAALLDALLRRLPLLTGLVAPGSSSRLSPKGHHFDRCSYAKVARVGWQEKILERREIPSLAPPAYHP